MKTIFRLLGLYEKGKRNALQIEQHDITFSFENLPPAFDNYTILFISDLHLDALDGLTEKLQDMVKQMKVDLCILGGDIRTEFSGPFSKALIRFVHLTRRIQARDGIYAVLGNHDCVEMIPMLQERGIIFLVNDANPIERDGQRIWIAGVDDPNYYNAHDLDDAFREVPSGAFTILAAHSPEIYQEAEQHEARLYLCGHTHAGQIQLPGIGPVFTHSKAPRHTSHGTWEYKKMLGYTSSGAGVSGIPVRFGCRGEVVHITLKSGIQPR